MDKLAGSSIKKREVKTLKFDKEPTRKLSSEHSLKRDVIFKT
jgi:hypothetical protein